MKPAPEFWRDIPGTDGKYQASRAGDIRHVWPSGMTSLLRPYLLHSECHKRKRYRLHVHLRVGGKDKVRGVLGLVAAAWKGKPPEGMIWHHANGNVFDNSVGNIQPITHQELGRKSGGKSTRRSVEMIDREGNVVSLFVSARAAARENHMSYQAVIDRCHGKIKKPFELMGYTFRYEDGAPGRRKKRC